jgi:PPOX class probable F420-dependent enzyme
MDLDDALAFARRHPQGVLATVGREGRPQLSNIVFGVDDADLVRISVTDSRVKTKNLRRDPRASLYVPGGSFWSYVVLDGTAELSGVAARPDDEVVDELVSLYRSISGEHPDWGDYRRAMAAEGRLVVRLRPERAYGMVNE